MFLENIHIYWTFKQNYDRIFNSIQHAFPVDDNQICAACLFLLNRELVMDATSE